VTLNDIGLQIRFDRVFVRECRRHTHWSDANHYYHAPRWHGWTAVFRDLERNWTVSAL